MAKRKTGKVDDPATPQDESVEEVAEVAEPTAEEQAVLDAKAVVDGAAQKVLDEAKADHQAATEAHAAAVDAATPKPELGKHILLDMGDGVPVKTDAPKGYDAANPDRRLLIAGQNYEHVADSPDGIWIYRRM